MPADEDDGLPRSYWYAVACPLSDKCSANSWKKYCTYSYVDEEAVKTKVRHHLMSSGHHHCSQEEADELLLSLELETAEETFEDRETYRKQCVKASAKTAEKKAASRKRPAVDDVQSLTADVAKLQKTVASLSGAMHPKAPAGVTPKASAASSAAASSGHERFEVSKAQLTTIRDSLARASSCCEQGSRVAQMISTQLTDEAKLLSAARNVIDQAMGSETGSLQLTITPV